MLEPILHQPASVFEDDPDPIGISFRTNALFHGSLGDCLEMLRCVPAAARAHAYIETIDGLTRLEPQDICSALDPEPDDRPGAHAE